MREKYQNEDEFKEDMRKANPAKVFFTLKYSSAQAQETRAGVVVNGANLGAAICFSFTVGASSQYIEFPLMSEFIAMDADLKAFQEKSDEAAKAKIKDYQAIVPNAVFRAGEVE